MKERPYAYSFDFGEFYENDLKIFPSEEAVIEAIKKEGYSAPAVYKNPPLAHYSGKTEPIDISKYINHTPLTQREKEECKKEAEKKTQESINSYQNFLNSLNLSSGACITGSGPSYYRAEDFEKQRIYNWK